MPHRVVLALVAGLIASPTIASPAYAAPPLPGVAVAPYIDENPIRSFDPTRNGEVPGDLLALRPGLSAAVDPVGHLMLFVDDYGQEKGRAPLPTDFRVDCIATLPDRVVVIDKASGKQIALPRSTGRSDAIPPVTAAPMASPCDRDQWRFWRRDFTSAKLVGQGNSRPLQARTLGPGYLAALSLLGTDAKGQRYSVAREITVLPIEPRADGVPRSRVEAKVIVGRHDARGRRTHVAEVPLWRLFKTPFGSYLSITPDGRLLALLPLQKDRTQAISLAEIPFVAERATRHATQAALDEVQPPKPATAVAADVDIDAPGGESADPATLPPVAEMRRTAEAFLHFSYRPSRRNLGLEPPMAEACKPFAPRPWQRPYRLTAASPNASQTGVPYSWGGKGSLAAIEDDLRQGKLAGNICTHAVLSDTTGIDCSGLVSRVWGVGVHGTATLHRVSEPLAGIDRLRWGDVFNKPGSHVRLYTGQELTTSEGMRIRIIESSTACGGVCARSYHVEQFHGYEIRRPKVTPTAEAKR